MIKEILTNNYELYKILNYSPSGLTRNDFTGGGRFFESNGYYFIQDSITAASTTIRVRRFTKNWTGETIVLPGVDANTYYNMFNYYAGYYYVPITYLQTIRKYDEDFALISSVSTGKDIHDLIKYKNRWFGLDSGGVSGVFQLFMFDSEADGSFKNTLLKTFSNSTDQMGLGTYVLASTRLRINHERGELLIESRDLGTPQDSIFGRYSLDALINEPSYNASNPYLIQKYRSILNQKVYSVGYSFFIIDGHYVFPIRDGNYMKGFAIYDYDMNLVSKEYNCNLLCSFAQTDNENGIYLVDSIDRNSSLPINFKKLL